MKIMWLSANRLGYELLKEAVKYDLKGYISSIVTLSKNSKTVMYDGIDSKKWYDFNVPVFEIERINDEENLIKKISPDIIIMCGWRQLINKNILNLAKEGVVGFHPSPLPVGRGPAPIINTILHGFESSALTMFWVGEGLDDGPIIDREFFNIDKLDHSTEVYEKVISSGIKLIRKNFPLILEGKFNRLEQDSSKILVFDKPRISNNEINLDNESLDEIYKKIKALSKPYLGAYIKKGNKKLIIWKAELRDIE